MTRLVLVALVVAGCKDEPAIVISPDRPHVVRDGRPEGYPVGYPIVPGARVLEGAVDPGVVRTSALEYEGDCAHLEQALRDAFAAANGRVLARTEGPVGTVAVRVSLADEEASFSMHAELSSCILRTVSSDREKISPR